MFLDFLGLVIVDGHQFVPRVAPETQASGAADDYMLKDPKRWRDRAEEARCHAEGFTDPQAKEALLRIAEEYEKLTQRAEQRSHQNWRAGTATPTR